MFQIDGKKTVEVISEEKDFEILQNNIRFKELIRIYSR